MRIEVATPPGTPTKEKGDLLEELAGEFLQTQGYTVVRQVRMTATELDLLCQHKVNKRQVYVECKAYRDPLGASPLKQLLGTLDLHEYQEAWLISAGPLGKDAKGFQQQWESKLVDESQKLSIYTPDRVLDGLMSAKVICAPPQQTAVDRLGSEELVGEWLLLVTEYGTYWVVSCLSSGIPAGVLVFSAKSGSIVEDQELLRNLGRTDSSQSSLDFEYVLHLGESLESERETVVEVEYGESWADYRPARPEHFVGRSDAQDRIFRLLETVRKRETLTRVFAITGDSGMGKSSLVAKLRARSRNKRNKRKFFTYAVDVRAAKGPAYILSALRSCLYKAAEAGFGSQDPEAIKISDPTQPLESESVKNFLEALDKKQEIVCLILDQFEELYSKTELFPVFEATQQLFLSTVAAQASLVLGFAWKSDATVQQNHPAYHMWHNLGDHRLEIPLRPFIHSEAYHAITIFEKELGQPVGKGLRRQLIENSQGYPWLLKKLCIHLYENIRDGNTQVELSDNAKTLFDKDLQKLTQAERTCLKLIAQNAPADWFEILEVSGQEVTNSLRDKRLTVRSGDRLNIYWDIFREYILTQKVPSIPLNYLPASPSIKSMLGLAWHLDQEEPIAISELAGLTGLTEKSAENVVRDLVMFGVATSNQGQVLLDPSTEGSDPEHILQRLRHTLRRHTLRLELAKMEEGSVIDTQTMIKLLKEINPAAQHNPSTWEVYADRMGHWLTATGYLVPAEGGWLVKDQGKVAEEITRRRPSTDAIFIGDTSPAKTVEALEFFRARSPRTREEFQEKGYRNAVLVLSRFGLVRHERGAYHLNDEAIGSDSNSTEIIWKAAQNEPTLTCTREFLVEQPTASGPAIGHMLNEKFQREWTASSEMRIGNSIRQWAIWSMYGQRGGVVSTAPGRTQDISAQTAPGFLFDYSPVEEI